MHALLLPCLLTAVGGDPHQFDEACLFIGARFARTNSTCKNEYCTGFKWNQARQFTLNSTDATLISCALAIETVRDFLGSMAESSCESADAEASEITSLLRTIVLTHFER